MKRSDLAHATNKELSVVAIFFFALLFFPFLSFFLLFSALFLPFRVLMVALLRLQSVTRTWSLLLLFSASLSSFPGPNGGTMEATVCDLDWSLQWHTLSDEIALQRETRNFAGG